MELAPSAVVSSPTARATPIQTPQHCIAICTSTNAPAWGCDISRTKEEAHRGVSIHAPTWGATFCSRIVRLLSPFQSTHPHGVRPAKAGELLPVYWFQSTHPHEVRPNLAHITIEVKHVSIHAPAWGATYSTIQRLSLIMFQSTHPHGVRLSGKDKSKRREVSIHAPAWGATNNAHLAIDAIEFQSTHPHGVRLCGLIRLIGEILFQSTHPHGVRQDEPFPIVQNESFNPRTRMGCDSYFWNGSSQWYCFNPRTRMGCDLVIIVIFNWLVFQSTHPHGVRPTLQGKRNDIVMFQSTHPHGVRLGNWC